MKNTKSRGIVLGTALLGIASLGLVQPSQARPRDEVRQERRDVKQARKDVKHQRKDVRQADTAAERRREQQDVIAARQRLERQRQQLQNTRRNTTNGSVYNRNRPVYNQNRPYYGNNANTNRTLEGVVSNDLRGNVFTLRLSNGQNIRVQAQNGEPNRLSRGDTVRVSGFSTNGIFHAQNLAILRNR